MQHAAGPTTDWKHMTNGWQVVRIAQKEVKIFERVEQRQILRCVSEDEGMSLAASKCVPRFYK